MDARDVSAPRAVDGVADIASHRPTPLGRCGCGVDVHAGSFRDRLSYREWWIRPACQDCQDRLYLARDPDTGEPLPLRRGAVVAVRDQDFAALPFLWTVPAGPRAWEARHAVRVGPTARQVNPYDALEPMRSELQHHQVAVHTARASWHGVKHRLRALDVVVALDAQTLARARCLAPVGRGVRRIILADAALLSAAAGLAPERIVAEVLGDDWLDSGISSRLGPDPLALCARIAAVLGGAGARARSGGSLAFEAVLAAVASCQ